VGLVQLAGQKITQLTHARRSGYLPGHRTLDNSLVDPDNRRPVDFAVRRDILERLEDGWLPAGRLRPAHETAGPPAVHCGCAGARPELFSRYDAL